MKWRTGVQKENEKQEELYDQTPRHDAAVPHRIHECGLADSIDGVDSFLFQCVQGKDSTYVV